MSETYNDEIQLNLYDLNKTVINQLSPLTEIEVEETLQDVMSAYDGAGNIFHMLLCRDFNYYTLFVKNEEKTEDNLEKSVCEIITELGQVYSIENTNDGAIEIWIKPNGDEAPYAFYLFPYDAGVVYYG